MSLSKEEPLDLLKYCVDCKELYKNPRLLRCMHVLCEQSILDMLKSTTPKCPVCGDEAGITVLAELPPLGLVETDPEDADGDICIIQDCAVCDEQGTQHCKTCDMYLCTSHADEHRKSKKNSDHQVEPTVTRKRLIYECRLHARREYTQFCMSCLEPVCDACLKTDKHTKHTILPVKEAFEMLHNTVSTSPDATEYLQKFEKDVTETFNDIIDKLQKRRDELVNEGRAQLLAGQPDYMTLEVIYEQMKTVHQWDEMAQQKPDQPLLFLHIFRFLMRCVRKGSDDVLQIPSFSVLADNTQRIIDISTKLGRVVSVPKRQRLCLERQAVASFDWKAISQPTKTINIENRHLWGIVALGDDLLVVSDPLRDILIVLSEPSEPEVIIRLVYLMAHQVSLSTIKDIYGWLTV